MWKACFVGLQRPRQGHWSANTAIHLIRHQKTIAPSWPEKNTDVGAPQLSVRNKLASELAATFGVTFNEKQLQNFPSIKAARWCERPADLIALLHRISAPTAC